MFNIKNFLLCAFSFAVLIFAISACGGEDKSKRPSPLVTTTDTLANGNAITVNYSSPSLKGRKIGKDIAPFGEVWRTGANEATTFEISKDSQIEGKPLPKGKYSLYTIPGDKTWTVIFNKTWDQWGTEYNQATDALRVQVAPATAPDFLERMKFVIERDGRVLLFWGDVVVGFQVQ